ncbi:MAG: aliphatic sulfonate ABC transporter substrate-binding protein [Candidatus Omnitrophica bacterium]|nr:aliphatic sulfonate ABC transporter substrate-binding protein [Candidatus Omnitrophota bacterium]
MKKFFAFSGLLLFLNTAAHPFTGNKEAPAVRVGHFSNLTHAQALVGRANGWFNERLSPDAPPEWKIFNAGPSAAEAIFAGQVDIAYIGPSPAVNGFIKSNGEALRIVAGAASGGAALVVREDAGIKTVGDFHGKKIASPQLGNTQDVAIRAWLSKNKFALADRGGDVQVLPVSNADQQTLFLKKEIDGAWTVEPWVSLLMEKANGKIFLEESGLWPGGKYATTVVVVRKKFLDERPALVKKFLKAHADLTDWIRRNPVEAKGLMAAEIERETTKALPPAVLDEAFKRIEFLTDPLEASVKTQADAAYEAGFLKKKPDLAGLFDLKILKELSA